MDEMLLNFKLITILKTEIFRVNLNFLDKGDLEEIKEVMYDMGLEKYFTDYDLESLYNSDYDKIKEIYEQWSDEVLDLFDDIQSKLNGRLNKNRS
jgi:hypothetical protein